MNSEKGSNRMGIFSEKIHFKNIFRCEDPKFIELGTPFLNSNTSIDFSVVSQQLVKRWNSECYTIGEQLNREADIPTEITYVYDHNVFIALSVAISIPPINVCNNKKKKQKGLTNIVLWLRTKSYLKFFLYHLFLLSFNFISH